jgi:hypothetical protein
MRAFLVYTVARTLVLLAVAVVLYGLGLRGFLLAAFALLLSLPLSYVLLARQRVAFGEAIERRVGERRARRADLRTKLRGDDEPSRHEPPD